MTDKDIAALREDAEEARKVLSGSYTIPREGVTRLLAEYGERCAEQMPRILDEIDRLRADLDALAARYERQGTYNHQLVRLLADRSALLEIARAVAAYPTYPDEDGALTLLRTQARTLLGETSQEG